MKIDEKAAFLYMNRAKMPSHIDKNDDKKLKEVTDKFEAFFIKKILDVSLKNDNTLFGKDAGDKIYHSMYNDAISNKMGGKFGFSQMLFDFLKQNS